MRVLPLCHWARIVSKPINFIQCCSSSSSKKQRTSYGGTWGPPRVSKDGYLETLKCVLSKYNQWWTGPKMEGIRLFPRGNMNWKRRHHTGSQNPVQFQCPGIMLWACLPWTQRMVMVEVRVLKGYLPLSVLEWYISLGKTCCLCYKRQHSIL